MSPSAGIAREGGTSHRRRGGGWWGWGVAEPSGRSKPTPSQRVGVLSGTSGTNLPLPAGFLTLCFPGWLLFGSPRLPPAGG